MLRPMVAIRNETGPATGELLREVARLYSRAQRVVAECCRTTATQCHILCELGRSGAMPMNELGTRLLLEKSWVSRAVDTLVGGGLVRKDPNPGDARSWIVSLTADGRRRVKALGETLDDHAEQLLGRLSAQDRAEVQRALRVLLAALQADRSATCCLPAADSLPRPRTRP
jgi:DNA-binding MarR family transcriptional regulator